MYDPFNSSSSRSDLAGCQVAYPSQFFGLWTVGNRTQDTIHLAGLKIENQTFESVAHWWPYPFERDDLYDSVLGLSLRDIEQEDTTLQTPSLFQSMLSQGLLDDPLFTLRLSRKDEEVGELTLGGIPKYIDRDQLATIPLTQNFDAGDSEQMRFYSSNGWQVALEGLAISDDTLSHENVLSSNYTAVISTSSPWMVFPWNDTKAIWSKIGFGEDDVPCDARAGLPNITFRFGSPEQQVTLTPWDYVLEVYNEDLKRMDCQIMIGGMNEHVSNGFVILGSSFLNGLYSVWDAGNKTISFANRPL
jgi:saccharopepsin